MIVYPDDNYDSWISWADASDYFQTRLNVNEWHSGNQAVALQTAFRSLNELDLDIDLEKDETPLSALKQAQCEQALHELKNDLELPNLQALGLGGMFSVRLSDDNKPSRYSERAMAILRPYVVARTVTRTR